MIVQALGFLIIAAYPALLVYPGWVLYRRTRKTPYTPWIVGLTDDRQRWVRLVGGVLAFSCLIFVVGVLISQVQFGVEPTLMVVVATVIVGAAVLLVGLAKWHGNAASWMRVLGWVLIVGIVVIPSSLTLMLPLVAPLMLLLHRVPAEPSPA